MEGKECEEREGQGTSLTLSLLEKLFILRLDNMGSCINSTEVQ